MAYQVPTTEPYELTAGDTWSWTKELSDYPASTWTLSYALANADDQIAITATADGDTHRVSVSASTTSAYTVGFYDWQSYVTSGAERHQVASGRVNVLTNFAAASTYDGRTHARKTLDALEAMIAGSASKDVQSYSIAGRSLSSYSPTELLEWRRAYRAEVVKETMAERRKRGSKTGRNVLVRFG